ncbi:baseplate tail tube cap [Aeromonas phage AsFcp_4]|uniref:Gp48 baseplate tail tube cap n=1 Tax=Aeromonas phage PX29 TaxID=926067 RepID=E5DQC0_9CAUD|nr:baseplate tail tube cap [Aeromonas phage PX29]ADQ52906.1 gp48 baseplate tail tube cap [Aeromonas phage PX29]QAX98449.1 baseplate tail tube cap [Aeromonas phage AsFcp_2]QAX99481.1 baseplate tail tube cap [Aeromonas phage AsFcp_4]
MAQKITMLNNGVKTISDAAGKFIGNFLSSPAGDAGIQALQYPLAMKGEIERHKNYLCFYCVEAMGQGLSNADIQKRSLNSVTGKFNEKTLAVIQMYMPNLNQNVSHEYSDNDGGFLQDMAMNYAGSAGSGVIEGAKDLGNAFMTTAMQQISVNIGKASQQYNSQISGKVLGNRSANMYKNTSLRTQTFLYNFRPKNVAELKEVGQIIRAFLIYSSPSNAGVTSVNQMLDKIGGAATSLKTEAGNTGGTESIQVLKVPPLWYLEERVNSQSDVAEIRYTPKFAMGPCALSNIRITSTPEQIYNSFAGTAGDPIAIDLELTFTELRPVFREYWESLTANLGGQDSGQFFFGSFSGKDSK